MAFQQQEYEQTIRADERKRILSVFRALLKISPFMESQYHGQYAGWTAPPVLPAAISELEEMKERAELGLWRDPLFCLLLDKKIKKHRKNFELFQKWEMMVEDILKGPPAPEASDEDLEKWMKEHRIILG